MKNGRAAPYHTYLLRCWRDCETDSPKWHFSLECVYDRQRQGFADLEALLTYLQALTEACADSSNSK